MLLPNPASFEKETLTFLEPFRFGGHQPSLEHIAEISRFFSRLPYENISKILKRDGAAGLKRFRLPDEVTHDHFAWHLGGTCFSLSYFLCGLYTILGYQAQPLVCHLNWGQNNHSAIAIDFDGARYLVDPGYMIFRPLPLKKSKIEARLSAETGLALRFDTETDEYAVYTFRRGQYIRRYRFADKPVSWEQYSTFWDASFDLPGMNDLTLTRVEGLEMIYIQGDFIKMTSPEAIKKIRAAHLAEKLIKERFRIPLEKLEQARYVLRQRQA
jgi:arylamine N-acetyltransferase